uniref:Uncharacterized protein n=1 Tax=Magnetospirillum gryphiswaldense TaxID=55518 RepID=A4TZY8_9PROT|nr:conserved hypothetical protein, membrane [Magnetospirillum gryphiswaldense MSR-1]
MEAWMFPTRILIGGFAACAVSLGLGRFAYTPILPLMGIDTESAGWLAASNNLGYLIGAIWASWAASERERHRLLNFGLALVALSLAAMALTHDELVWNLIRLAAGMGSALVFVLGSALVVPRLAELGRAKLSGLHFGGVGLGIFASGSAIAWIGAKGGDDSAWWAAGGICAALSATSFFCLRHLSQPRPAGTTAPAPPVPFPLPLLAAAYFCAGFGYIITGTFLVVGGQIHSGPEKLGQSGWGGGGAGGHAVGGGLGLGGRAQGLCPRLGRRPYPDGGGHRLAGPVRPSGGGVPGGTSLWRDVSGHRRHGGGLRPRHHPNPSGADHGDIDRLVQRRSDHRPGGGGQTGRKRRLDAGPAVRGGGDHGRRAAADLGGTQTAPVFFLPILGSSPFSSRLMLA